MTIHLTDHSLAQTLNIAFVNSTKPTTAAVAVIAEFSEGTVRKY